jgi:hypothetical protein
MDISTFRQLVDETFANLATWPCDLAERYSFLGMPQTGNYSTSVIGDELYRRIHSAFEPGVTKIAQQCRDLIGELIHELILEGKSLDPCCELLAKIKDATQYQQTTGTGSREEWRRAIKYAHYSVQQMSLNARETLHGAYPEYYAVAYAAARLKSIGYSLQRSGSNITLSPEEESRLVQKIESIISEIGGLCMAQKINILLNAQYDLRQERYHIIKPRPKPPEPHPPLIPFGYLYQLAAKHYQGGKSSGQVEQRKVDFLFDLARDYATIIKVQDYSYFPTFPYALEKLVETLQKKALEDTIYKIPQIRGRDVPAILLGLIDTTILDVSFENGGTTRQAISVVDAILNNISGRGVSRIYSRDVRKQCRSIPGEITNMILGSLLSHPEGGANQKFSKPTDGSNMTPNHNKEDGANFSQRPLLRYTEQSYHLLNRSFCSEAFLESIFTQLRSKVPNFDGDYLGKGIERYVRQVLREHDIDSSSGDYWIGKTRWECDIVVETNKTIIFIEVKKKPLTRKARAGSDVSVVMDLAQSLLDAQKQAGNHEVQLRKAGYLDLLDGGNTHRIELKGRTIERIALSLTDFGSFHDRTFLEKFMNAVTQLKFGVYDKQYKNKFDDLNEVIASLQEQGRFLYPDNGEHQRPYFNCWFFSLPQLIIILDGISGPEAFRNALWAIRGITTGQGDLCFDLRYAEQMRVSNPDWYAAVLKMADSNKTFVT